MADTAKSTQKKSETDKSELVTQVMQRFDIPSYEAWDMTEAELTKKLEG